MSGPGILRLLAGAGQPGRELFTTKDPRSLLLPPDHELPPPTFWEQHGWQIWLGGALLLVVVALLIVLLLRRKPSPSTPPEVLDRRELETLRGLPENGVLLMRVSGILRRQVVRALGLPPGELTTAELIAGLKCQAFGDGSLATTVGRFFVQCDESKFAPAPAARPEGAVATALDLFDRMESARKQPVTPPPIPQTPPPVPAQPA